MSEHPKITATHLSRLAVFSPGMWWNGLSLN